MVQIFEELKTLGHDTYQYFYGSSCYWLLYISPFQGSPSCKYCPRIFQNPLTCCHGRAFCLEIKRVTKVAALTGITESHTSTGNIVETLSQKRKWPSPGWVTCWRSRRCWVSTAAEDMCWPSECRLLISIFCFPLNFTKIHQIHFLL